MKLQSRSTNLPVVNERARLLSLARRYGWLGLYLGGYVLFNLYYYRWR